MRKLLIVLALMASVSFLFAEASYLGVDNQDVTVTSFTVPLPAGSNNIGSVGVSGQGNDLKVNGDGSIDVNASVSGSTVTATMVGSQGVPVTTSLQSGSTAMAVLNVGQPNLAGKSMVYASSNSVIVGGTISLTGLGKSADLLAIGGSCTFSVNGGDALELTKNTSETFDFGFTLSNPSVVLSAKDTPATCKVRLVGAN